MGLFDRPAKLAAKLATRTTLLLPADPGDALLDAARRYDPQVRRWHDRLIFQNGVLLTGPVTVTPEIERRAGLPAGMALAWYTGAGGLSASQRRSREGVVNDGDHLVRGLADRLGGTVQYSSPQTKLALIAPVYSEQDLPVDQVAEVLRPHAGTLKLDEEAADTYTLSGKDAPFLVFYRSPRLYLEENGPPAVGAMRSRPLCHWDLHAGLSPEDAGREVCLKVGNGALALASRSSGIALDILGFIINSADDLVPRSRLPGAPGPDLPPRPR
jgi:hypothetical protein